MESDLGRRNVQCDPSDAPLLYLQQIFCGRRRVYRNQRLIEISDPASEDGAKNPWIFLSRYLAGTLDNLDCSCLVPAGEYLNRHWSTSNVGALLLWQPNRTR